MFLESVEFNSIKDTLTKLATDQKLVLMPQVANEEQLAARIKKDPKLPQEGVLAVNDFKSIDYIYVISTDKEKSGNVNAELNKAGQFQSAMTVNNRAWDGGIFFSVIVPNKK